MSIEAFVWNYCDGEQCPLSFDEVMKVFSGLETDWDAEHGRLEVTISGPPNVVDIYFGREAESTRQIAGLTISRPLRHDDFLDCLFAILNLGHAMLFYSDETTPIFRDLRHTAHYPPDLLAELGVPRVALSPRDLLHQAGG